MFSRHHIILSSALVTLGSAVILLSFPELRSGVYGWVLGIAMVTGVIVTVGYLSLLQAKEAEQDLDKLRWKELPLYQQALIVSVVLFILLVTTLSLHGTGLTLLFLPLVFSIAVLLVKFYLKQRRISRH